MGTTWHVVAVIRGDALSSLPGGNVSKTWLYESIGAELTRINALMSTWQSDSELSQFNAAHTSDPQTLSEETVALIQLARSISQRTDGAYDVTRGNVYSLWGFGPDATDISDAPSAESLASALNASGFQKLSIAENNVTKLAPELSIDLSSIAKGYAVDRLGELLENAGIKDYLVEIGGEVRTRGRSLNGKRWRIGVESPATRLQPALGIAVEDAHMASSGDYRNFRKLNGRRVTHIINGQTGLPVTHDLAAVTVLHESTALADAWATAFMVLGYKKSAQIARADGLAASFTVRHADRFDIYSTPQWLIVQEERPHVR